MTLELTQNISALMFKLKGQTKEEKLHAEKLDSLRKNIDDSREKLYSAQQNFNNVTDIKLIDFYIYKIQAEQSRFEQLLKEYKAEELSFIPSSAK